MCSTLSHTCRHVINAHCTSNTPPLTQLQLLSTPPSRQLLQTQELLIIQIELLFKIKSKIESSIRMRKAEQAIATAMPAGMAMIMPLSTLPALLTQST
jgi:hypothetical protein